MAVPLARIQVAVHRDGGLPEDDCVNTLHFEADESVGLSDRERWDVAIEGLMDRVELFYGNAMAGLWGSQCGETATIKAYDMRDPETRYPRQEREIAITPGGTGLPSEVALCISFRGANDSGIPIRRRTGRIYLGPLIASVSGVPSEALNDYRPTSVQRDAIINGFVTMATGETGGAFRLAIYSRLNDPSELMLDAAWNDAVDVWIDNSWDIVRKRGSAPTSRVGRTIT